MSRKGVKWAAGLAGVGLLIMGLAVGASGGNIAKVYQAYWVAFIFYLAISLGAIYFVLIQHLTRSAWSVVVRRIAEHFMRNIGLMAVLMVPVLFGMPHIFEWAHATAIAHDPIIQAKAPYLNVPFFWIRAVVYFTVWCGISWVFFRLSRQQDTDGNSQHTVRMQAWAGAALALFGITQTFASFDWLMSLSPHWYSTLFGVIFFCGSAVVFLAVLSTTLFVLRAKGILKKEVTVEHYHDLGKLLYGYTLFWGYLAFAQFLVVWVGAVPEEGVWYLVRGNGGSPWQPVTIALAVGYFLIPLFVLMSRHAKRNLWVNCGMSVWLILMPLLDYFWTIQPNFSPNELGVSLTLVGMIIGMGALYLAPVVWQITRHPIIPIRDPRLKESLEFENF